MADRVVDLLLIVGLVLWIVGVGLRFVDRRRHLAEHFPKVDAPPTLDGIGPKTPQIANSRRVTTLLVAGTLCIAGAGAVSWLAGSDPRAPDAARELESIKQGNQPGADSSGQN